jgi:hypothetical protein
MDKILKQMAESFVTMFINDWKMILDRIISEEDLYSRKHDDAELESCCFVELEELEETWQESFLRDDKSDDVDDAVACINKQIREYIYELSSECGYSGNYIENALASIAKKGEVSRVKAFVDCLGMEKDG